MDHDNLIPPSFDRLVADPDINLFVPNTLDPDGRPENYTNLRRKRIILRISCILIPVVLFTFVIIIIVLNVESKKLPDEHKKYARTTAEPILTMKDISTTILTQSSINHMSTTQPAVPLPCLIPAMKATWNQESTVFVNPDHQCLPDANGLCKPQDLFIDNVHDNLYVVDTGNSRVQKYSLIESFDPQQGAIGVTVASKGLIQPQSIFVDSQTEDMYILDHRTKITKPAYDSAYRVQLWKKNDEIGKVLLSEVAEYGLFESYLTLDKEMNIYVGTRYYIRKWLSSTNYTRRVIVAGKSEQGTNGASDLWDPSYFCVDNNLTLYIADRQNKRIQKWLFNATEGITITSNPTDVYGLAMDCNGHLYYNNDIGSIYQFNLINNEKTVIIGDESRFHRISSSFRTVLTFDKFGNIFATDLVFSCIRKFSLL